MTTNPHGSATGAPPAASDEEFSKLVPALFGVLHRLVRRGVPIDLGQGMDHVHDFYLEAWPGVRARFDARKGEWRAYAIAAFYRFARRRAIRALVVSRALEDLDWCEVANESRLNESAIDRTRVLEAYSNLTEDERGVLCASFDLQNEGGLDSDRAKAYKLGLSAHRFHELRSRAIAALAVRLGERGVLTELEFRVAKVLFVENRSIAAAATTLGLTEPQVRHLRQALLARLRASLGSELK